MILYQPLEKNHVPQIVKLESELLLESLGEEMLCAELHNKYAHFIVALDGELPVGYIGGWMIEGTCDMINFVVDKDYQHQGIGQNLFKNLENIARSEKCFEILLEVRENNAGAIKFYEKAGFKQIAIRNSYYKNGENALILRKELL